MADKNTPIPFTVGDQVNLAEVKAIKTLVEEINKKLDPTIPVRVTSLESTRTKQTRGLIALLITIVGGLTLWGLKALLMASTGIPVP